MSWRQVARRTGRRSAAAFALALLWSVSAITAAHCQDALKMASQKLAGATSKEWVLNRIIPIMGVGDSCSGGPVYRFYANGTLVIEECPDSKLVRRSARWALSQESALDIVVTIDGTPYRLLFRDDGKSMRLRQQSDSKVAPTLDREFRLSED
jgi:hypothetical protein